MRKKLQSPGNFLSHLLNKYQLTVAEFAGNIGISPASVRQLTQDKTKISTAIAMRLAKYFNTVPEYWLVHQMRYDIIEAQKDKALAKEIRSISKIKKPSAKKAPAKKKETPADKRRKAGKVSGAKPAARSKGTKTKSRKR